MADEEAPHDWDPDREKRQTDPGELARSFVRAAAEEQAKIEKEMARRGPPMRAYTLPPLDLQLSIHRIKNGFVVTYGQGPHGHPLTVDLAEAEYAKDRNAALCIVNKVAYDFLKGFEAAATPPPVVGPAPTAQPGPDPFHPGPFDGPLEPEGP